MIIKDRFKGKVMIITGAAGGIGYSVAERAAREGAAIVFSDVKEAEGKEALLGLRQHTPNVDFLCMDLTSAENAKAMIDLAIERYGYIDILINNAGISGQPGAVHVMTPEMFERVLACNVMTMFYCSHFAVQQMLAQATTDCAIVNVSSVAGLVAFPGNSAYITSKHAVNGLTKSMAMDYAAKGIRVNAVNPGIIQTPMQAEAFAKLKSMGKSVTGKDDKNRIPGKLLSPQNRIADPQEVADVILFLASEEASHVTGVLMPVDGGFTVY